MTTTSVLSTPLILWDLYIEYLWNYEKGSWVNSLASYFRVLAFLLIAPFVLLTLLDVVSYIIARTLGVIDDTKASTSYIEILPESSSPSVGSEAPSILIQDESSSDSVSMKDGGEITPMRQQSVGFPGEGGNLKLSGVGVFSPAPSQPPSPTLSRKDLSLHMSHQVPRKEDSIGERGKQTRLGYADSDASSSGESSSSYAMLEKEPVSDDVEIDGYQGVQIRKRHAGTGVGEAHVVDE